MPSGQLAIRFFLHGQPFRLYSRNRDPFADPLLLVDLIAVDQCLCFHGNLLRDLMALLCGLPSAFEYARIPS